MRLRCWLGIHAWRKMQEYLSLGTLSICLRCDRQRWT